MTFKSFLVLEPNIIKAYIFSYAPWGKLCLSRKAEVQTYFVLTPKAGTVRKNQTNQNHRNLTCIFFS